MEGSKRTGAKNWGWNYDIHQWGYAYNSNLNLSSSMTWYVLLWRWESICMRGISTAVYCKQPLSDAAWANQALNPTKSPYWVISLKNIIRLWSQTLRRVSYAELFPLSLIWKISGEENSNVKTTKLKSYHWSSISPFYSQYFHRDSHVLLFGFYLLLLL